MYATRSELNGIDEFYTLRDAQVAADCDPTIWKISKLLSNGELFVLIRTPNGDWERVFWDIDVINEEIKIRQKAMKP